MIRVCPDCGALYLGTSYCESADRHDSGRRVQCRSLTDEEAGEVYQYLRDREPVPPEMEEAYR